jgi:hypothetical protein
VREGGGGVLGLRGDGGGEGCEQAGVRGKAAARRAGARSVVSSFLLSSPATPHNYGRTEQQGDGAQAVVARRHLRHLNRGVGLLRGQGRRQQGGAADGRGADDGAALAAAARRLRVLHLAHAAQLVGEGAEDVERDPPDGAVVLLRERGVGGGGRVSASERGAAAAAAGRRKEEKKKHNSPSNSRHEQQRDRRQAVVRGGELRDLDGRGGLGGAGGGRQRGQGRGGGCGDGFGLLLEEGRRGRRGEEKWTRVSERRQEARREICARRLADESLDKHQVRGPWPCRCGFRGRGEDRRAGLQVGG